MDLARLTFEAVRMAEAMGIVEPGPARVDTAAIRDLASRIRRAGIGMSADAALARIETPSNEQLTEILTMLVAALEASPVPKYEWKAVGRIFPPEELGSLLDVSASSLKRYQSGERDTPDLVAARLYLIALVAGDLAGSYNDTGVRRWFERPRSVFGGRSARQSLTRRWTSQDEAARRILSAAESLQQLGAT